MVQSFVKPIAGVVAAASVLHELTPLQGAVLALVLGGGVAATMHLGKANLRLASSTATGGLANPVVSAIEDGGAGGLALTALFAPLLAVALVLLLVIGVIWLLRRRRNRTPALRPV